MVKHGQVYNKQSHNASLTVVNMHRKSLQFCRICPLQKIYYYDNLYTDSKSCIQIKGNKYKSKEVKFKGGNKIMDIRYSANQRDVKRYTTQELRDEFLIQNL